MDDLSLVDKLINIVIRSSLDILVRQIDIMAEYRNQAALPKTESNRQAAHGRQKQQANKKPHAS